MKKNLHLTDPKFLPEITEADNAFALRVKKDSKDIPFNELVWLIRDIRSNLEDKEFQDNISEAYQDIYNDLLAPDIEIKSFNIVTNRKKVKLRPDTLLYPYFMSSLEKVKAEFEKRKSADIDAFVSVPSKSAFLKLVYFVFENTPFSYWKKRALIGMFVQHFSLLNREWQSEPEWRENPTNHLSHKHYLADNVKSLLKKYKSFFL